MTDTDNATTAATAVGGAEQTSLAALKLPELRRIAAEKGLRGVSGLRKGELITAIQTGQVPARTTKATAAVSEKAADRPAPEKQAAETTTMAEATADQRGNGEDNTGRSGGQHDDRAGSEDRSSDSDHDFDHDSDSEEPRYESRSAARRARRNRARQNQRDRGQDSGDQQGRESSETQDDHGNDQRRGRGRGADQDSAQQGDGEGRRGRRNRRNRRNRNEHDGGGEQRQQSQQQSHQQQPQQQGSDGADLQDVAGILDVADNNTAFLRTTGYHASPADVFVNNQIVRRFGLRSGDAITGQVKMGGGQTHGQGRNRQKYNQLVRVDSVNGMDVETARRRPEFSKLTPLYPNQRLRLETEQRILTTRVIDLIMPIGKGQRALIVSPPKAGKTTILQNIANAISTNNPECYLMVVLVDERPEEVTDMQRSVNGEVISSTFDRPPSEHTAVAELAIERAKRLVEQGRDVVVLLDSITRLGRAYNNSSPASGRILSGGVDSNALYPPKRFLGAARNIEDGGSLTIIATAMVETGSAGDTVIFEEFKGTGNAELKLDRKISERRVFPAVDVNPSGTRKDDLLLHPDEARVMHKLRRILSALDPQQAIDLLIKQLKKTKSNTEFLAQVASSAPMAADKDEEEYL